jgi:hypothetical protein
VPADQPLQPDSPALRSELRYWQELFDGIAGTPVFAGFA